ncbi:MAG: MarR family transcriptional regulator [Thermoplasmata archaeon]
MEINEVMEKFLLLKKIMGNIIRKIEIYEDLSISEIFILLKISDELNPTLTRLSELTGFSNSLITFAIDNFEEKGLVRRKKGKDRRTYYVELTDLGREKCKSLKEEITKSFMKTISAIENSDLKKLNDAFDTAIKILQKIELNTKDELQGEKS